MAEMRPSLSLPALLVAALVAPACDTAEVRPSASPAPRATPSPAGTASAEGLPAEADATPASGNGCSGTPPEATNAAWEQQVIELVNQQRRANGLPPLKHVTALSDAARWYAKDMVDDGYFGPDHDTYDWKGGRLVRVCAWGARLGAYYPGASARGENLGEGHSSPHEVVAGWMGSSRHRANILNGRYWETGVGYQAGASDEPRWVQDFGRRRNVYPVVIDDEAASTGGPLVHLYVYGSWREVRLRNDSEPFSPWRPFTSTVAWSLANVEGLRTVSVEMRSGSTAVTASDTIELSLRSR
jgi:uncharacterized protein YkwD